MCANQNVLVVNNCICNTLMQIFLDQRLKETRNTDG